MNKVFATTIMIAMYFGLLILIGISIGIVVSVVSLFINFTAGV